MSAGTRRGGREAVLARVRAALSGRATPVAARPRAPYPAYDDTVTYARAPLDVSVPAAAAAVALFRERLAAAHGRFFDDARALAAWLASGSVTRGYCDPALAPALAPVMAAAGIALETAFDRARADDYQVGITRASGAIAETGSVILDDAGTSSRLGALAPWIHVAVLPPDRVHARVADAVAALGQSHGQKDDPYVLWCTGPSKTADVEGILIEGVHGPGEQVVLLAALAPGANAPRP